MGARVETQRARRVAIEAKYAQPRLDHVSLRPDALEVFGDRRAALANDLTKLYELMLRGRLSELIEAVEQRPIQGEWVLVIAGTDDRVRDEQADDSLEGARP